MAPKSAERGKATRRQLHDAAVARRAGVAPGVVHYHFASVTDLLVAAGLGFTGSLLDQMAAELSGHPGIGEGVDWLLGELSRYLESDAAVGAGHEGDARTLSRWAAHALALGPVFR